jgi:ParB family transcriptional regulator, chromosome partitioning protein
MPETNASLEALRRLVEIAKRDTGQSRRVANFLLAWHNAEENGGWDPIDLWNVDAAIADDIFLVLILIRSKQAYPGQYGLERDLEHIWSLWRKVALT